MALAHALEEVGRYVGHIAHFALLAGHVVEVFAVEGVRQHVDAAGGGKHLRVTRPAHAFIALRAIGGHIHKIGSLPPDDVFKQAVHARVRAFEFARALEIRMHHALRELFGRKRARPARDADIAEAKEGKQRRIALLALARGVNHFGQGGAHIFAVEIAVLIQHFAILHADFHARRRVQGKAHQTAQFWPKSTTSSPLGVRSTCTAGRSSTTRTGTLRRGCNRAASTPACAVLSQ